MKVSTQKRLFAVFLVIFEIGLLLLLYDFTLSLILLVPSGVGISVLLTERTGITTEWWQFVYLKVRGKTRKMPERKKMSPRFIASFIAWLSFGIFVVYMLFSLPSIGVLLFYVWFASGFISLYYQFGTEPSS